jgi:hypothetical protein
LRGKIVLAVQPDPLIVVPLGDDYYEATFDIIMREEGGVGTTIEDFTVEAIAFRTVTVQKQTLPATYITDRIAATLPASRPASISASASPVAGSSRRDCFFPAHRCASPREQSMIMAFAASPRPRSQSASLLRRE